MGLWANRLNNFKLKVKKQLQIQFPKSFFLEGLEKSKNHCNTKTKKRRNMIISRPIDHIVYAVKDLETACNRIEQQLGVRPVFGGYHRTEGTKNALLNLGNGCYLELLAIDYDNQNVNSPRWMGIDLLQSPCITRWAIKSSNLPKDSQTLKNYDSTMGHIKGGERKMKTGGLLKWELIMPKAKPLLELVPFMVDWQESTHHPTDKLSAICPLKNLQLYHPHPTTIQPVLDNLSIDITIQQADTPRIAIQIKGRYGLVEIT